MLETGSECFVIVNFVMKLYGKYEFEVESGSSYFGVEDQGTYEFSFIRYDDCLGFEINQIIFSKFNIVSSGISTLHLNFNKKIYNALHREIPPSTNPYSTDPEFCVNCVHRLKLSLPSLPVAV